MLIPKQTSPLHLYVSVREGVSRGVVIVSAVLRGASVSLSDRDGWHREEKTGCCCRTFRHVSDVSNAESAEPRICPKEWSVSGCDANFEYSSKAESYRRADIPLKPELGRRQRTMTDAEVDFCPECGRWLVCMIKDKTFIPDLRWDITQVFHFPSSSRDYKFWRRKPCEGSHAICNCYADKQHRGRKTDPQMLNNVGALALPVVLSRPVCAAFPDARHH